MTANLERAAAALKTLREQPGFDEATFALWDAQRFTEAHGISSVDLTAIIQQTRPKVNADRFIWLEAINQRHDIGVRGLRVAIALFSFAGEHGYCWPSQIGLARRAGYRDKDVRSIRRSLADLDEIGSIRRVGLANFPAHLASKALGAKQDGGSGRSYRGTGYALVPPEQWSKNSSIGSSQPSNNRVVTALYNHQYKPAQASPDNSSNYGAPAFQCLVY